MRLRLVRGNSFVTYCYRCEKKIQVGEDRYANLDGDSFRYLCYPCKLVFEDAETVSTEDLEAAGEMYDEIFNKNQI